MSSEEKVKSDNTFEPVQDVSAPTDVRSSLMRELDRLPSSQVMPRITEDEQAQSLIPQLPSEDFFWLVKKVGDQDCLPLLRMASEEQWQYLLDLEMWQKDRLDLERTSEWIKRLQEADPKRHTHWLFAEGQSLAYYYLFQTIEVVIAYSREEIVDLPEGFFSIDGIFHVRSIDPEQRETVENLLRSMASESYDRYQALMMGLVGVLPAELEEKMLRMRNVRIAEHGFLPFEEAISVYAPLAPDTLRTDLTNHSKMIPTDEDTLALAPVSALDHAGTQSMLTEVIAGMSDPIFLDRLRMQFAGLCNQILSADNLLVQDLDVLIKTCRRAAGYLNLALERLCGEDLARAQDIVQGNPLVSLFRVGFGLAVKLKWQAERWLKDSWFATHGFDFRFWGEQWGGTLIGIVQKRPRFYAGIREAEEYRDFQSLDELGECLDVLRRAMVLDGLLDRITEHHPLSEDLGDSGEELTFRTLLFTFWARNILALEPGFHGITLEQARNFFRKLRGRKKKPPYPMEGFGERFVKEILDHASDADPEAASILSGTLSLIWKQFQEEYEWVSLENVRGRHSRFLAITSSPEAAHR